MDMEWVMEDMEDMVDDDDDDDPESDDMEEWSMSMVAWVACSLLR